MTDKAENNRKMPRTFMKRNKLPVINTGKRPNNEMISSKTEIRIFQQDESSSASSEQGVGIRNQDHARPRVKHAASPDTSDTSTSVASNISITASIDRFRNDFDDFKCKMQIFGESLSLCKCIAADFKTRLNFMERRLQNLERREVFIRSQSNYSAIIQKNKRLSTKCIKETKKLQMCGNEDEMREVAAKICKNYLHGAWKTVEATSLDFKRISGGLSNFLYYVALPDDYVSQPKDNLDSPEGFLENRSALLRRDSMSIPDEPRKVLLRIYGQVHGERAMDAIVTESVIFTLLSERRLGPKLYGVFSGGRIEEYIPARPLLTKELAEPALSMKIAEKMAAIHSMDIPLSKEPSWLWKSMGKWMKTVRDERLNGTVKTNSVEEEHIVRQLKTIDFEKEIEWLKKYIATVESPCVFCHNDMQEGNILILEDQPVSEEEHPPCVQPSSTYRYSDIARDKTLSSVAYDDANTSDSISSHISECGEPRLFLIDFEYCAYNYRGFDIANHFQEWGFDYTNPQHPFYFENQENCPTLEQKEIFIKEYLKHYNMNASEDKHYTPSIDDINHLLNEVEAFALASHLFWCLWSVVNASKSQITFGYWEYAISRLETYQRLKQEVVKKDKFGISSKRKICEVDI